MTDRALPFANVSALAESTTVSLPAELVGFDRISIGGEFNPGSTIIFIPPESGTPETAITFESSSFGVTATLTSANPVTLQFQGVNCTATVPASLLAHITVPDSGEGTGLPSGTSPGTGAVVFEAIDAFFTPADEPFCTGAYDSLDAVTSPSFEIASQVGSNKLIAVSGQSSPTIDPVTGALIFTTSPLTVLQFESAITELTNWTFFIFEGGIGGFNGSLVCGSTSGGSANGVLRYSSDTWDRRGWQGNEIYWNGQTNGSGGVVVQTSATFTQHFENDGSTSVAQSNYWMLVEGASNFGSIDMKYIGALINETGVGFQRPITMKLLYISTHSQRPSDADIQKMQGFAAWLIADRISGTSAADRLPVDHPYDDVRPALTTGGGVSGITLVVPVVKLTITNIPEAAEVRLYDLDSALPDFGTELAGIEDLVGTTFEYSHSKSGDDIMLQIFADGFKELNQPITLASVSQTVNAAELLEAEDAL